MTVDLGLILAILTVIGGFLLYLRSGIVAKVKKAQAEKAADVKDEQLELALNGPRTRDDVIDKLRDGTF